MITIDVRGVCSQCGQAAETRDSLKCGDCRSLEERIRSEAREETECQRLIAHHMSAGADKTEWDLLEQMSLVEMYRATANVHNARKWQARVKLDAREDAYTAKLEEQRAAEETSQVRRAS